MRNFLISLSGARTDILEQCPAERIKFQSLGWALLITASIAVISMWFALASALGLNPVLAFPLAVTWGLVILGVDRWLIISLPFGGPSRWLYAIPRVLLALLLGTLISTPIVLRVFQPEIDAQVTVIKAQRANAFLQQQQHSKDAATVARLTQQVANLQDVINSGGAVAIDLVSDPEVKALTAQRAEWLTLQQNYYTQWQCQLYGGPGCTAKGNGPLAQASRASYLNATAQVKSLNQRIQNREAQLQRADTQSRAARLTQSRSALPTARAQLAAASQRQQALVSSFDAQNARTNGLLIRLQALNELSGSSVTLNAARFLLFLLFLVIECLPVMVKLLQRPGTYELVLGAAEARELREAQRAYRLRPRAALPAAEPAVELPAAPSARQIALRDIWRADDLPDWEEPAATQPVPAGQAEAGALLDDLALRQMSDTRTSADHGSNGTGIELRYSDDDL